MSYFRGTNKFRNLEIVPGGMFAGFGYSPPGKNIYVDYLRGNDSYVGTNPNYPLKTIAAAFLKITDSLTTGWKNDYIWVLASKDQDDAATIYPTVAAGAEAHWHLIGVSNANPTFGVVLRMDADNEEAACITLNNGAGVESEIAGISFGGGATGAGGISLSQTHGLWVHDCYFGHSFCGDTPDYGIYSADATNHENCLIEDCWFWGSGNNSQGKLAVDGIRMLGATPPKNVIIRRNVFMGIPGVAIYVNLLGGVILDNRFSMDADTAGSAITLDTLSYGCFIDGNSANFGDTDAATGPPWLDNSAGGADSNTWGLNWEGGAAGYPA